LLSPGVVFVCALDKKMSSYSLLCFMLLSALLAQTYGNGSGAQAEGSGSGTFEAQVVGFIEEDSEVVIVQQADVIINHFRSDNDTDDSESSGQGPDVVVKRSARAAENGTEATSYGNAYGYGSYGSGAQTEGSGSGNFEVQDVGFIEEDTEVVIVQQADVIINNFRADNDTDDSESSGEDVVVKRSARAADNGSEAASDGNAYGYGSYGSGAQTEGSGSGTSEVQGVGFIEEDTEVVIVQQADVIVNHFRSDNDTDDFESSGEDVVVKRSAHTAENETEATLV